MESKTACGQGTGSDACATNMGDIQLRAGDLVGAYRSFLPMAESGNVEAMLRLVEICERAGDSARAQRWRQSAQKGEQ